MVVSGSDVNTLRPSASALSLSDAQLLDRLSLSERGRASASSSVRFVPTSSPLLPVRVHAGEDKPYIHTGGLSQSARGNHSPYR
jgi:hypothetical protein